MIFTRTRAHLRVTAQRTGSELIRKTYSLVRKNKCNRHPDMITFYLQTRRSHIADTQTRGMILKRGERERGERVGKTSLPCRAQKQRFPKDCSSCKIRSSPSVYGNDKVIYDSVSLNQLDSGQCPVLFLLRSTEIRPSACSCL